MSRRRRFLIPGRPVSPYPPALTKSPSVNTGAVERPAELEEVAFWPVTKLARLIESRQVSSSELTEMYLARLKLYDPHLRCVVTLTEEMARAQAAQADAEIAAGNYRGILHGIPWGAKDLLAVKGYKTTWGATPYKDQLVNHDATVVERLRDAGAVLVAKLTTGALAYGDIWFDGKTKNPWDLALGLKWIVGWASIGGGRQGWSASLLAQKRLAPSSRPPFVAAPPACDRPSAPSAAPAAWP